MILLSRCPHSAQRPPTARRVLQVQPIRNGDRVHGRDQTGEDHAARERHADVLPTQRGKLQGGSKSADTAQASAAAVSGVR